MEKIRKSEAEKAAARRAAETPKQKEARRNANKLYQQRRRAMETQEESDARKQADLQYHKNKFLTVSLDQSKKQKKRDLSGHKKRRARGSEKNYEEVYVRVFPSGRKEIIGFVDDRLFNS